LLKRFDFSLSSQYFGSSEELKFSQAKFEIKKKSQQISLICPQSKGVKGMSNKL
jgi:hypothetical protein